MSFELYCRLYIQSELSKEELKDLFATFLNGTMSGFSVANSSLLADVRENCHYNSQRLHDEQRFVFSRYTAEVEPLESECVDSDVYIECVCDLISKLRRSGVLVTASCEFEEIVSEKTGWNWTETSREHPPTDS